MRIFIIILILCLAIPCFAEQVWVKSDAEIEKKSATASFEVTAKMKTDVLKLGEINIVNVQRIAATSGKGSIAEAKKIIEEMLDDKTIVTKEQRYSELYPTAELEP